MHRTRVKQDAWDLTKRVFDDAVDQLDALVRLTDSQAKKKQLTRGAEKVMQLRNMALRVIDDFEEQPPEGG